MSRGWNEIAESKKNRRCGFPKVQFSFSRYWIRGVTNVCGSAEGEGGTARNVGVSIQIVAVVHKQAWAYMKSVPKWIKIQMCFPGAQLELAPIGNAIVVEAPVVLKEVDAAAKV
jgi:hypothetical protein